VTASAQALYFDSRRRAGGGRDLWRAPATAAGWGPAELVPNVNSSANDQNAWVSPDERLLVFNSDRGGGIDLWASVWSGGSFGAPFALSALNSDASDEGATLTRDGLTVFFASNRPGGNGGLDMWVAVRASLDAAFSTPVNLGAINSDGDELDLALGPDGQELFFSSSRDGTYQLYRATRGCDAAATASTAPRTD
jgi:Tol biopolymer transport system component